MQTAREGLALKVKFESPAEALESGVKKAFKENGIKIVENQTPNLVVPECNGKLIGHLDGEQGVLYLWEVFYRGMPADVRNRVEKSLAAMGVPASYKSLKSSTYVKPKLEKNDTLTDIQF